MNKVIVGVDRLRIAVEPQDELDTIRKCNRIRGHKDRTILWLAILICRFKRGVFNLAMHVLDFAWVHYSADIGLRRFIRPSLEIGIWLLSSGFRRNAGGLDDDTNAVRFGLKLRSNSCAFIIAFKRSNFIISFTDDLLFPSAIFELGMNGGTIFHINLALDTARRFRLKALHIILRNRESSRMVLEIKIEVIDLF